MATMNISLPEKLKKFVEDRVSEGNFSNASDFVRDLIRRDQERKAAIQELQRALDEGEGSGFAPFVRKEFEQRLAKLGKKKNAA
jgi:antitoxin ParD1/3/4